MEEKLAETSTAALAVTVKPAVNSTAALVVAGTAVAVVGVVAGVAVWRKYRKNKTLTGVEIVEEN